MVVLIERNNINTAAPYKRKRIRTTGNGAYKKEECKDPQVNNTIIHKCKYIRLMFRQFP